MHIILKQSSEGENEILNMFYCPNQILVRNWVKEWIANDIAKRTEIEQNCETKKQTDVKSITYEINDGDTNFQLIRKYKKLYKGYIYNSSEKLAQVIYKIYILDFDENVSVPAFVNDEKWADINNEINNRVLKRLDKNSLYQIIIELESKMKIKSSWNRTEYVGLVSETIQNFKKALYSSIAKRMHRFGKAKLVYDKKENDTGIPNNFSNKGSCQIDFLKDQNKNNS